MRQLCLVIIFVALGNITCFSNSTIHIKPISDSLAIKVSSFNGYQIANDTVKKLQKYPLDHARCVIIDLRDNTGGYIYEAIAFAALFINQESLITLNDHQNQPLVITRPIHHPYIYTNQLYIIINENTASAAEAAAYILTKHHNAFVIGSVSHGKTSIAGDGSSPSPYTSINLPNNRIYPTIEKDIPSELDFDSAMLSILAIQH